MSAELVIEIIGAVIGLVYLYCEYKAHISLWIVGIVMSVFYIYIYFRSGLFANAGIYLYNLGACIYGLIVWYTAQKNSTAEEDSLPIRHCPKRTYLPLFLILIVLWLVVWAILLKVGNPDMSLWESFKASIQSPFRAFGASGSPVLDSFTAALGMVAMWVMARKYIEHWFCWLTINLISSVMCFTTGLYPAGIMFIVYTVGSVLGIWNWHRKMTAS